METNLDTSVFFYTRKNYVQTHVKITREWWEITTKTNCSL